MTDINIKIKTKYSPEIKTVTVKSDSKVEDIMKEIEKYSNIPPEGQKLIFKGKILNAQEPISTYKIENDVTLIMVKTAKAKSQEQPQAQPQAQPQSQPQQSAPTNNVSSNPEDNITLKVKTNLDATIHNVPINKNSTVLALKGEIEKVTHIPPGQQKLINKGITMKDTDPISAYGLTNDSTIAMVKTNEEPQGGLPNLGSLGGLGGMPGVNPQNLGQIMNNPQTQQAMNELFNNPEFLEQVLNSPEMRPYLEQNPQLRQMFQDPQMRQLLLNPQFLQRMAQLGGEGEEGEGEGEGFGEENISVSQTPNTRLGECFTQWMSGQREGTGSRPGGAQPQQPRPQQPVFQQFPQPDPNVDYKEKYKDQMAQIKEMGIDDEEKIIDALKKCDGNVQYALNRLFG